MPDTTDDGFDPDAGRDLSEATIALPPHVGDLGPDASGKPRAPGDPSIGHVAPMAIADPDAAVGAVDTPATALVPHVSTAGLSKTDLAHIQKTRRQLGLDETDLDYAAYRRLYEHEQNPRVSPNAGRYDFDREAAMAPVDPAHVESTRTRYQEAIRPLRQIFEGTSKPPLPPLRSALQGYVAGLKAGLDFAPRAHVSLESVVENLEHILDNN